MSEIKETKGIKLSVRLEGSDESKFLKIMNARGLNKTDTVKYCIRRATILQIGKVKDLAVEFYKIRAALETSVCSDELVKEVNELCQSTYALIQKIEALDESAN